MYLLLYILLEIVKIVNYVVIKYFPLNRKIF